MITKILAPIQMMPNEIARILKVDLEGFDLGPAMSDQS